MGRRCYQLHPHAQAWAWTRLPPQALPNCYRRRRVPPEASVDDGTRSSSVDEKSWVETHMPCSASRQVAVAVPHRLPLLGYLTALHPLNSSPAKLVRCPVRQPASPMPFLLLRLLHQQRRPQNVRGARAGPAGERCCRHPLRLLRHGAAASRAAQARRRRGGTQGDASRPQPQEAPARPGVGAWHGGARPARHAP